MEKYVGGKEASKILGVHQRTLYQWDKKGWIKTIRTPGNKRLYNVEKYINLKKCEIKECEDLEELNKIKDKLNICYVRVSTHQQKDDMERQKEMLKKEFSDYIFITDIGSGINFNRKGLRKIIDLGISGKINKVVVAYKDRLTRFGYELIEDLIKKYSEGEIIVLNKKGEIEPEKELALDVLQIMNVFTAKMNGLRKYNKK
jgi:predicted site-specific integrase-resolvase